MKPWVDRFGRIVFGLLACWGTWHTAYSYLEHKIALGEGICHAVVALSLGVLALTWGKKGALTEAMKVTIFAGLAIGSWLHDGKTFYPTIFAMLVLFLMWRTAPSGVCWR
jgi:hypothetical protein